MGRDQQPDRDYQPLPIRELGANAGFRRPLAPAAPRVTPEAPAVLVMTDLTRVSPATIRPQAPLAGANQFMITRGMVPAEQVEVIDYADVAGARVGHVFETLRRAGRQHALVVDFDEPARRPFEPPTRRTMVRGIFSLSQIARQVGVAVEAGADVARTLSEIETAIK
jgi:hypothetical protein